MNDKLIVWVLALGFIVTAVWFVGYSSSVDALNDQLTDTRASLQSVASILSTREKILAQKQLDRTRLTEIEAQLDALQKQREPLSKKIDFLTEQPDVLLGRISEVVQNIRQRSMGRDCGNLRLPSGAVLEKAKLQKITDTHVTVSHTGGVARLDAKTAPPEIVSLFRLRSEMDVSSDKPKGAEKTAGTPSGGKSSAR